MLYCGVGFNLGAYQTNYELLSSSVCRKEKNATCQCELLRNAIDLLDTDDDRFVYLFGKDSLVGHWLRFCRYVRHACRKTAL